MENTSASISDSENGAGAYVLFISTRHYGILSMGLLE